MRSVIDADGFRANVGILLCNRAGRLFWGKRVGMDAWQFPQGGIRPRESVEGAMFRELREETGLLPEHVDVLGNTAGWLRYQLPEQFIRRNTHPVCIGQKQIWYLVRLVADERHVNLNLASKPEFDRWRWIEFWEPARRVVDFKREVYRQVLDEFAPLVPALLGSPGRDRRQAG